MPSAPEVLLYGAPALLAGGVLPFVPERRFQLLAVLALKSGEWVARDRIAALLWPEHEAAQARRNLRNVVFKAHSLGDAAAVQGNDHALRWDPATDLQAFERAIREGHLADAVALRRGSLLEGLDDPRNDVFTAWLAGERQRLDARWHEIALAHLAGLGDAQARAEAARRLLAVDPLDEDAVAALIEAELEHGRGAQARHSYVDFSHRLMETLGVEPSHRLRDLMAPAEARQQTAAPARHAPGEPRASAAVPPRGFIGRRIEVVELLALLRRPATRLVTLLGPGGVGKSSLAQQLVAEADAGDAPASALWIELQDLPDLASVAARIAGRLELVLVEARDFAAQIAAALSDGPVLLVLDNAEHLAELASFVDRLLGLAPSLRVLATSRSKLHAAHEQVYLLGGLAVPDAESRDLEAASAFDSVRLFEARAASAQRGFDLARHLAAVIDGVEAVSGLPLAIELMASWVRLLPPEEINRELRRSIDVLERDPARADAPARPEHRSLRAVLEGTWQLLSRAEQEGLAAISEFRGGFAASAARAVAGVPISVLSALADKSVVAVDGAGRFGLHPLVQAFAVERLQGDGEHAARIARRHAEHFGRLVGELVREHGPDRPPLVAGVEVELSNVLAAWRPAHEHRQPALIGAIAQGLRATFHVRGRMAEGIALLSPALAVPERDLAAMAALAQVQHALASLRYHRRDLIEAARLAAAGLAGAERCHDRRLEYACLAILGACHSTAGRWQEAAQLFERAFALASADGERGEIARSLADLGVIAKKEGDFALALERYGRALEINRELGRDDAVARCLNNIGVLWMERSDWARARDAMQEGVALCARQRNDSLLPYLENGLGLALFELGELGAAERHLERSLQLSRATEVLSVEMLASCLLARVATRRGRHGEAVARFREAAQLARRGGLVTDLLDIALYWAECQRDSGRRLDAARTWLMVAKHPNAEAGIRASAAHWTEALELSADERRDLAATPTDLDQVIEALLGAANDTAGASPAEKR
jgi:DNA-binding SARP family transcriptional activator/predicted ATPase/Tfp pilus assembly protein PilF